MKQVVVVEWRGAGNRTKAWLFDGSVIFPMALAVLWWHWLAWTILLLYAFAGLYMNHRGRSMKWLRNRIRFWIRNGVILARTPAYCRAIRRDKE